MPITIIGLNHKTAPIEIREQFFLTEIQQELLLSELKCNPAVVEAIILSTCNRTEIYLHLIGESKELDLIVELITGIKKESNIAENIPHLYIYKGKQALRHLFNVVTGLDSQVLGEKQILGQVKHAFERSQKKGMLSKPFNILGNIAVKAGKKAQTETDIGFGGSSVSWAAIVKAEEVLGSLEGKSVLIIGAGKMSILTVGQICNKGFKDLYLMNRTHSLAKDLADKFSGQAVAFTDMKEILGKVDLCICSSSAPHYIIDHETVKSSIVDSSRQLVFIDISMPRNINPNVAELENAVLFDIDHLDSCVEENMLKRREAIKDVESIIEKKMNGYLEKIRKVEQLSNNEYYQIV